MRFWEGSRYCSSPLKLLVVGDSHYDDEPLDEGYTAGVIRNYIRNNSGGAANGCRWHRPFTSASRIIVGNISGPPERRVWHHLAFFNYFGIPAHHPNDRSDLSRAEDTECFRNRLNELAPDLIFIWGARVYRALANELIHVEERLYRLAHGRWVFRSAHPSRGYSPVEWEPKFCAAVRSAGLGAALMTFRQEYLGSDKGDP